VSHKYIRVTKYKARSTEYCKYCMYNVVQNVIQNSLYTANSLCVIFVTAEIDEAVCTLGTLMVMKQPFHSPDLGVCLVWNGGSVFRAAGMGSLYVM